MIQRACVRDLALHDPFEDKERRGSMKLCSHEQDSSDPVADSQSSESMKLLREFSVWTSQKRFPLLRELGVTRAVVESGVLRITHLRDCWLARRRPCVFPARDQTGRQDGGR